MTPGNKHLKINILYEDEVLIAINKSAQLLVIPDRWDPNKPSLISILHDRYLENKIYVIHRLDKDTSGVVLFARTTEAHKYLNHQIEERRIAKTYFAIVKGEVEKAGVIDIPMDENPKKKGKMMVRKKGKVSITEYQVLERFRGYTFLKVIPKTGRTHQIRVHLQAIGHPLLVDPVYGGNHAVYLSELKRNYKSKIDQEERPLIDRLTLHAGEIQFIHPVTEEKMTITAEIPRDMSALLKALSRYRCRTK